MAARPVIAARSRAVASIVVLAIATVVAACGPSSTTVPPSVATPSTDPSTGTSAAPSGATVEWELPNMGIRLALPEDWVRTSDRSSEELEQLGWTDPGTAGIILDGWQRLRTMPGWDTGLVAGQPASGMILVLRFVAAPYQADGLDALDDVLGVAPTEVSDVTFLDRPGRQDVSTVVGTDGIERTRLGWIGSLTDGRLVSAIFLGPADRFDLTSAVAALEGAVETGRDPAGEPWDNTGDPELEAALAAIPGEQLLSGNLLSMVAYGAVQGNDLLTAATTIDRLIADPTGVRAAISGPPSGQGATATVLRWATGPADMDGLRDALTATLRYRDGTVGTCEALLAPALPDEPIQAAILTDDRAYWLFGTDAEVDEAAGVLLGC